MTPIVTVAMLRDDRTVRPDITGIIHDGLRGNVTGLSGNVTGLRGNVSGLRGDVDYCDISDAERDAGVAVATLVLPA